MILPAVVAVAADPCCCRILAALWRTTPGMACDQGVLLHYPANCCSFDPYSFHTCLDCVMNSTSYDICACWSSAAAQDMSLEWRELQGARWHMHLFPGYPGVLQELLCSGPLGGITLQAQPDEVCC